MHQKPPSAKFSFPYAAPSCITWLAGATIVFAAIVAYDNSLSAPFIFDDRAAITQNHTIRQLWPVWSAISPPRDGSSVTGRPMVNLSLAVNYAMGKLEVRGYHVTNLLIHVLSGLVLFGIVSRTLARLSPRAPFGRGGGPGALLIAVIWTVHPLQTESVTCVVQRTESLVGLFFLLTLYGFVRSVESVRPALWRAGAVLACLAGMAAKEVMVAAPVVVLLYDRTFVAESFRAAWQKRRRFYLWLGGTWLLLIYLVFAQEGSRGATASPEAAATWSAYVCTQFGAIVRYLSLAVWPAPLVLDYGTEMVRHAAEVVPQALLLVALLAGTLVGLWRWPVVGFLGACFFAILAPSSSVVPLVAQPMAEHRMYLPLAALLVSAALGLHALVGRRSLVVGAALALGGVVLTVARNDDYRTEEGIWRDTVAKRPGSARAHYNLGCSLESTKVAEAITHYETAVRLNPDYAEAHNNLAPALEKVGRRPEAVAHVRTALRLRPDNADALGNLAIFLLREGRRAEAIGHLHALLRLRPEDFQAHIWLGNALMAQNLPADALRHYETALRLNPQSLEAHVNSGVACVQLGRAAEAIQHYETILRLQPGFADAHHYLGTVLLQQGRLEEATGCFETALRLKPDYAEAHANLGVAWLRLGRPHEAIPPFEAALRLQPGVASAHENLGVALSRVDRIPEAINQFRLSLQLQPDGKFARDEILRLTTPQSDPKWR